MNQGFFEFELRSGDRTFIATVELLPPGLEASEARAKVPEEIAKVSSTRRLALAVFFDRL